MLFNINKCHDLNPLINSIQIVHNKKYIVRSKQKNENRHGCSIFSGMFLLFVAGL